MSDQVKRARSPNYPAISLPDALIQLRLLFDRIQKHKAPKEAVLKGLGYGGWNGASATALSAHLKYGILERLDKDEFKITDLGMRLLFHQNPAEFSDAVLEAASLPPLFYELMNEYAEEVPHEDILRPRLIRQGFAQSAVPTVISSYRGTMELVMANPAAYKSASDAGPETAVQSLQQQSTAQVPAQNKEASKPAFDAGAAREEKILDDEGNAIIMRFPVEPTVETYEFLKDYLDFRVKRMRRSTRSICEADEEASSSSTE